jgi:hypothetical protein
LKKVTSGALPTLCEGVPKMRGAVQADGDVGEEMVEDVPGENGTDAVAGGGSRQTYRLALPPIQLGTVVRIESPDQRPVRAIDSSASGSGDGNDAPRRMIHCAAIDMQMACRWPGNTMSELKKIHG